MAIPTGLVRVGHAGCRTTGGFTTCPISEHCRHGFVCLPFRRCDPSLHTRLCSYQYIFDIHLRHTRARTTLLSRVRSDLDRTSSNVFTHTILHGSFM